jgi:hypothetical protein
MQLAKQDVVDCLRKAGLIDAAEEAARVLPDPVDADEVERFLTPHGITVDVLISQMGGSP